MRLIWIFMSTNLLICLISAVGLGIYSERKLIRAAEILQSGEFTETNRIGVISGTTIIELLPQSLEETETTPWSIPWLKPHQYYESIHNRGFRFQLGNLESTLRSVEYSAIIILDENAYEINQSIGEFLLYFVFCLGVLNIFQIFAIFSRSMGDRKMVRRTLDPIAELARAAQSLNAVNKQLDRDKTMALAGKLDGIDAARLDTRIQVDDLQEELKNVAVAINGMLDRINESYIAQARFVSDASHELRTPIAVIQGYANLLDRWGKEDEKALSESVAAIKDEAGNMKDLVEQLLFLARGDSNRITLVEEPIELAGLMDEVALEAKMLEDDRVYKISSDSSIIMADRALIKQALRILLDNAVKFTDAGDEITISAKIEDDMARISVSDTGIGIRPEVLPRVFDRFVRADESRARATGGAGLGLSIAQWITARHNGHMDILSREGIGTRISLLLPIAPPTPAPTQ